jgi:hypothetical protein
MTGAELAPLGLAAGAAVASGLRVYATVAALGLLERLGVVHLPPGLEVLAHPAVIALASLLYAAEFVADKVPAFDSVWDAVHTPLLALGIAAVVLLAALLAARWIVRVLRRLGRRSETAAA